MTGPDAELTNLLPVWQTPWTSEYLAGERFKKYAARVDDKLIALGTYEILNHSLVVHIVYMEAQPESNPNLDNGRPKYTGIGRLMIACGIKLFIDNGFIGDVVLEAKTTELARHYERDFGAILLSAFDSSAPQCLYSRAIIFAMVLIWNATSGCQSLYNPEKIMLFIRTVGCTVFPWQISSPVSIIAGEAVKRIFFTYLI